MKKCKRCLKFKSIQEFTLGNKEFVNCNPCRKSCLTNAHKRKTTKSKIVSLRERRVNALKINNFVCGCCLIEQSISNFNSNATNTKFGYSYICKSCSAERSRFSKIKKAYGLNKKDLLSKYQNTNKCCEICKTKVNLFSKGSNKRDSVNIDHNHVTGKTRGILCNNCNRGLGLLKDDIKILKQAIKYLVQYKSDELLENPEEDNQQPS